MKAKASNKRTIVTYNINETDRSEPKKIIELPESFSSVFAIYTVNPQY